MDYELASKLVGKMSCERGTKKLAHTFYKERTNPFFVGQMRYGTKQDGPPTLHP